MIARPGTRLRLAGAVAPLAATPRAHQRAACVKGCRATGRSLPARPLPMAVAPTAARKSQIQVFLTSFRKILTIRRT